MNGKLKTLYNQMDSAPCIHTKEYMRATIILIDELREKCIEEFTNADFWALEEIQLLSDQINKREVK